MKILVDAKELAKAFNAVANARNHFTEQSYAIRQLQTACDILGPMWVNGINEIESEQNLEDSINQQVSDSAWAGKTIEKHDDSQIPVRSKKENMQDIKDSLAKDPSKLFPDYIPVVKEVDHSRRPIEFNPPCAEYCIPEVEKIMWREVCNHRAIIEILDIMIDSDCNRGWTRTTTLRDKVIKLKSKMVGVK